MRRQIVSTVVVLGLAAAILVAGCGPFDRPSASVSERDVIGTFRITWEPYAGVNLGRETLTLKRDHSFEQVFYPGRGKPRKNSGRWTLEPRARITLEGYVQYIDNGGWSKLAINPKPANLYTGISKYGKTLSIGFNDDMGLWYRKK